jgi:hypothetical protein
MKGKRRMRARAVRFSAFAGILLLILTVPIGQTQAESPPAPATSANSGPSSQNADTAQPDCSLEEYCFGSRCKRDQIWCARGVRVHPGTQSPGDFCSGTSTLTLRFCVKYDGDYVWAKDTASDGHGTSAEVGSPTGQYTDPRARVCLNRAGAGTWVRCNFDWPEDHPHQLQGGEYWNYGNDWCCWFFHWIQD